MASNKKITPINSINDVLNGNEELIYSCKPHPKAYFFSQFFKSFLFNIVYLSFFMFAIFGIILADNVDITFKLASIPIFILCLLPFWLWLYGFIKDIAACKHTEYAITNQRIIIKSGKLKTDIISIHLEEVQELNIRVGFIDSCLKVGDLYITSDKEIAVIYDIAEPQKVMQQIYDLAKNKKNTTIDQSKPDDQTPTNKEDSSF